MNLPTIQTKKWSWDITKVLNAKKERCISLGNIHRLLWEVRHRRDTEVR